LRKLNNSKKFISIKKEGGVFKLEKVFDLSSGGNLRDELLIEQKAKDSESIVSLKVVLGKGAKFSFSILSIISSGAKNSFSRIDIKCLILDEESKFESIPSMVVEENEIRGASHALAVSNIDQRKLFFMKSRCLDENLSKKQITEGFLSG